VVNMHSWVDDSMDELSNLAGWVSSRVELIHEEWMESFQTIFENKFNLF